MIFDVATFNSLCLLMFLCGAVVTHGLARRFSHVRALRYWATGFLLLTLAATALALNNGWQHRVLLFLAASLCLTSRILIWVGTRDLFGKRNYLREGLAVSAAFAVLLGTALFLDASSLVRAMLLVLFFLPVRALTLFEVCRRQRPDLGLARTLIAIASVIAILNATMPLVLTALHLENLSLIMNTPRSTSAVYAVVFAGDLLLALGLIVLALQHLLVERNIIAVLERNAMRRRRESHEPF